MKPMLLNVLKFTGVCSLLFLASFLAGTKVLSAEPTLLHLDFQDGKGYPVKVTHATLVLVAGGYVDKLPLEVSSEGVDLPLDASWLSANWPGGKSRLKNMDRAYVFLKAPGYASICSNPINWMGTETGGSGKNVVVSFPRGKITVVSKGQTLSSTVNFRKQIKKSLKVSDDDGTPLADVLVKSYVYWSKTPQGELNGADFLGEGKSDETGRIPVVDGDFTYAFQLTYKATSGNPAGTVLIVKRFESKEHPITVRKDSTVDSPKE